MPRIPWTFSPQAVGLGLPIDAPHAFHERGLEWGQDLIVSAADDPGAEPLDGLDGGFAVGNGPQLPVCFAHSFIEGPVGVAQRASHQTDGRMNLLDMPPRFVDGGVTPRIPRRVKILDRADKLFVDNALQFAAKGSVRLQAVCHTSSPELCRCRPKQPTAKW
jgi:hypothetical protein